MPETNLDKLKAVLTELFMLDQADLDFGIYRVMNAKRAEVTRFLDNDLLPQVRTALAHHSGLVSMAKQAELDQAIENARRLGVNPDTVPKVLELRDALQRDADPADLENEVFSDLANFFRRYYQGGDFLALRRYKAGVYAIPYEGEEVKLHWANADQYYIKTSEYLRDYTFKLPDGKRVHFKLVEADTEADNKKAAAGQERRFILCATEPLLESNGELVIRFEYRPDPDKRKQAELNTLAAQQIFAFESGSSRREEAHSNSGEGSQSLLTSAATIKGIRAWLPALAAKAPTEKNPNRTLLEKHLADYTARNTFDYFIHKDIGGFLRRELDFFIKNEIMHLDDIEEEQAPRVEQYLAKIRAIRAIARKIINFLEQLENFQKKLWLKKKFVVETNWCVTLDRVPESLYPEIAANDVQRAEWIRLFAIDEIQADLVKPGYCAPLTVEFLKANPFLVLDTKFFPAEFREKLLADHKILGGTASLDEATDGVLIHSENLQALNLLHARYREQVNCIYIDPPYNTGNDGFAYKDSYQHSSWLTMLRERAGSVLPLVSNSAVFFASIDDNEITNLRSCLDLTYGGSSFEAQIVVQSNRRGQTYQSIAKTHEYLLVYVLGAEAEINELAKDIPRNAPKDALGIYELWELRNRNPKFGRHNRPNLYYPIYVSTEELDEDGFAKVSLTKDAKFAFEVLPTNSAGDASCWRWGKDKFLSAVAGSGLNRVIAKQRRDGGWNIYEKARKDSTKTKSIWDETELINEQGTVEVGHLGLSEFGFPKPRGLLRRILQIGSTSEGLILDFFAGSGTTGDAVINLNREDGGKRKFILVEMGDHFDSVLKPRIQKVIYSKDWKDGKPVSRDGSSRLFKYLRLESYEDALNNLELKRTPDQDDLLRQHDQLREDYLLRYQLDVETRDSASLLNLAQFTNPFAYQLKVATGSVGESRPVNVDLIETFNYLLGLRVAHLDTIRGFRVVQGHNPAGEKVLVIWRNVAEKSNADLDAFFQKQGYNTKDMEFALIYVNGDNNLENLKRPDETWKVRRTEDEFKRLMFDVADV